MEQKQLEISIEFTPFITSCFTAVKLSEKANGDITYCRVEEEDKLRINALGGMVCYVAKNNKISYDYDCFEVIADVLEIQKTDDITIFVCAAGDMNFNIKVSQINPLD